MVSLMLFELIRGVIISKRAQMKLNDVDVIGWEDLSCIKSVSSKGEKSDDEIYTSFPIKTT